MSALDRIQDEPPAPFDRNGRVLHVHSQVVVYGDPDHRGQVSHLKRCHHLNFAEVEQPDGQRFTIETIELCRPVRCRLCGGQGGTARFTPGSRAYDPQTAEECPRCEGTGLEGAI